VVPTVLLLLLVVLGGLLERFYPELGTSASQMVVWGFCISTTVLYHLTSSINTIAHLFGRRVWPTRDQSRNCFLLALLTLGEGWHNNHHWHPGSVQQGFRWWQIDITYYVLRAMAAVGLISGIKPLPDRVRR
jgi:stearoyl-CoA desaturase (delta-9 desaturase)